MKIAIVLARVLLGALFLFFGLNIFFHFPFVHMPPPTGAAATYMGVLFMHHFLNVVATLQIIGGLLLLVGRFVPFGLVLLGPVIVNIILYHALLEPTNVAPGVLVTLLELFLLFAYRKSFRGLFDADPEV
jgi:putative oxidoreductase